MRSLEKPLSSTNPITSGSILPMTIQLSIPVLIGHLLNLSYAIVDTLFISMLDESSTAIISGIGIILPIFLLMVALGTGIFAGTSSLLARFLGDNRHQSTQSIISSSLSVAIIAGILLIIVLFLGRTEIIRVIAGDRISEEAMHHGNQYLLYFLPGMFFLLLFFSLAGAAQGAGLVKYFAMAMMASTICNMILDPICIFALGLGVKGAALASSLSIFISLILLYTKLKSNTDGLGLTLRLAVSRLTHIKEIVRIAIPQVLSLSVLSLGMIVLNFMVGSISETHMNAWVLVGRMDEIILIFGYAIGNATLTQVGQTFGSGNMSRLKEIYKTNLLFSMVVGVCVIIIYNLIAHHLFSLFSSVAEVVQGSVRQVRIVSFSFLGVLGLLVSNSMFQAIGRAMPGLILNLLRVAGLILPLSYFAIIRLESGITSLFIILVFGNLATLMAAVLWSFRCLNRL